MLAKIDELNFVRRDISNSKNTKFEDEADPLCACKNIKFAR